jgi:hypothetical protein
VRASDGDGTVPLLSLGSLCARHWREPRLNPSGIRVVTREFPHEPVYGLGELRCGARAEYQPRACCAWRDEPQGWYLNIQLYCPGTRV